MNSLAVKLWLSVLLLASAVYVGLLIVRNWQSPIEQIDYKSNLELVPTRPIADFHFTERSGKPVGLAELNGHVAVINFFFANCPGTCRVLNQKVADLQKEFADDDVRFVSITIDPSTDTPERLTNYAKSFADDKAKWWFLTAPLKETQELGRALHLAAVGVDDRGAPTHTDEIVVLDGAGTLRGAFDHRDSIKLKKAREKIRELLAEPLEKSEQLAASKAGKNIPSTSTDPTPSVTGAPTAATATSTATGTAK